MSLREALIQKIQEENLHDAQFARRLGIKPVELCYLLNEKRSLTMRIARAIYAKYPDLADVLLRE